MVLLWALAGKKNCSIGRIVSAWLGAAAGKAAALYLLVVQLLCRLLPLQPQQIEMFTAMFSLPQLLTALAGGGIALLIVPVVRRALGK